MFKQHTMPQDGLLSLLRHWKLRFESASPCRANGFIGKDK